MRHHLDTTFIIDWHRQSYAIEVVRHAILAGVHDLSFDPVAETEYFAAPRVTRARELTFASLSAIARRLPVSSEACRIAGSWLGRMDTRQRRRHFNDALIAAIAFTQDAILITADKRIGRLFPVRVLEYS